MKNEIAATQQAYALSLTKVEAYNSQIKAFRNTGTPETFDNLVEWIRSAARPETRNIRIKAVKAALLADAKGRGVDSSLMKLRINEQFENAGLKAVKVDQKITAEDVLTLDELRALIAAAPEKPALIVRALYVSACRVSELLSLRYDMAHPTEGGFSFAITGKGSKERTVFLSAALLDEIRAAFKGSQFLFVNEHDAPLSRQYVHRVIRHAGAAIGFTNLHPHTIRHTWATNNLDRIGLYKVSDYLGHTDISTTARFYLHNAATSGDILTGDI